MAHFREKLRHREAFAMRADVDLLALICETPPPPEVCDGVGIIYVRGPIDHHKNPLGVGCSYEQIVEQFHCLNDDPEVTAILFCIDSPGGLVSGLNATVRALRKAKSKPVYAIADEMMTSAAYAISCVADEILATPSAVVGSIGVISTMCSQARADKAMGLDFVTITSGARKADGHPHMPIEDAAVAVEAERVDDLAGQFFGLVDESRGLSPDYLSALEAGIFLGAEAEELGLIDGVSDVDEAIKTIAAAHAVAQPGTNFLALRNGSGSGGVTPPEASMLSAKAQIANLTRKMAASTSKKERAALASQVSKLLAALPTAGTYKKTYEKETEESSDEDEEEEEGGNETDREEEGDEDKKEASSRSEEESAESDDDEKKAEDDSPEKKDEDKKESKKASAKIAALEAEVATLRKRDAARAKADEATARTNTIQAALRAHRITPAEAKTLATKDAEYISHFLDARPKAIILSPEDALRPLPKGAGAIGVAEGGAPEAQIQLSAEQEKMLADVSDPKLREQIVKNWAARHAARESA